MTFTHSLVSLEALDRARSLARLIGGEDYLKIQAKSISDALLARDRLPSHVMKGVGTRRERFEVKRIDVKPTTQRRLNAKARERLRTDYPKAYRAAVKETAPVHVYSARLDPVKTGKPSAEWNGYKAEGVEEWVTKLQSRFGKREWSLAGVQAETLYDLRQLRRGEEARIEKARIELVDFVIENELPLIIPGLRDGRIVLRENGPTFAIDYDRLEKEFPAAATLITRSAVKGSSRIDFSAFVPTLEEPNDSDDSAFSRAYLARMRGGLDA